ncbi:MAG: NAD(P)/FAD-dependent oxidoreductase [Pseudomonadales bacterium]
MAMPTGAVDFVVVGAGMAGASLAWELSASARVLLLEREVQPGYHATGRSAAAFIPSYGSANAALRTLTVASYPFLQHPPPDFSEAELLRRRGLLTIAPAENAEQLLAERDAIKPWVPDIELLQGAGALHKIPQLRDTAAASALFEADVFDMDVDALHQGYLQGLRRQGGYLQCKVQRPTIRRHGGQYLVDTGHGEVRTPVLVNAAGAWADELALQAGVQPVGLQPLRRTAVLIDPPPGADVADWPLLLAQDESFYAKPDAGALLVSPADEHPSAPVDAQPEELDIAYAVHNVQQALHLEQPRVRHAWAGLRSFVSDRTPVIGEAADQPGFFWLCGQGGHGIQTAPAAAALAAALLLQQSLPPELARTNFDPAWVSPRRLRASAVQ